MITTQADVPTRLKVSEEIMDVRGSDCADAAEIQEWEQRFEAGLSETVLLCC